jgi:hypothetical protein
MMAISQNRATGAGLIGKSGKIQKRSLARLRFLLTA